MISPEVDSFHALVDDITTYQHYSAAMRNAIRFGYPDDAAFYATELVHLGEFIINEIPNYPTGTQLERGALRGGKPL